MDVDDLLRYVLPDAPACPDVTAKIAVVNAAIEFCRETLAWDEIQEPTPVLDKIHTFDIDAPTNARALAVRNVWAASRELRPVTMAELMLVMPNWQTAQGSEPAYYNSAADWGSIRVYPIPVGADRAKITLRVAYQPKIGAETLPDFLSDQYHEAMVSGALARLLMSPGRAWSNPALGQFHRQQFDAAITQARIDMFHDRVPGTVTVQPRRFGF